MNLRDKKLWLFDVDNTLIQDIEHPVVFDDAKVLVDALQEGGKTLGVLTNTGRLSSRQIYTALKRAGFAFDLEKIFSAGAGAAAYIHNRQPNARCFVISEGGARDDFIERGLEVVNNPPVDYVAVGADRGMTFQELNFAAKMLLDGAKLVCISGSRQYPGIYLGVEDVYIGELSIVRALEDATGVKAVIVGKPLPEICIESVKALGFTPEESVIVGDNPNSDIAGGNAAGLTTILVRRRDNIIPFESGDLDTTPTLAVDSLEEVIDLL
ncbi:MAG: HAD hydrolase-like protein [Candidatus Thorarchaeota archaeon]|nr:HAD hydrolase-like protein [Candidatus Thorarchaeota archaeon]